MNPLLVVLAALAVTLALELPLAAALAPSRTRGVCLATALCANLVTHPLAVAAQPALGFVPVELAVTAVECALFACIAGLTPARAIVLGVAANALSASCSA